MLLETLLEGFLGVKETKFIIIPILNTLTTGQEIGQGACKAVRLHFNSIVRNNSEDTQVNPSVIYYGDRKTQEVELLRGQHSQLIVTDRLEKIWVRCATQDVKVDLQVEILN